MPSYLLLAVCGVVLAYALQTYRSFARNLSEAKASGLPYVISPIYVFTLFNLVSTLQYT
jgi:ABC-type lipoprotein release transport system permease subunit